MSNSGRPPYNRISVTPHGTRPVYNKPYRTITEQIEILKARRLTINDEEYAERYLGLLGYQRIAEYLAPFLEVGGFHGRKQRIETYNEKACFEYGISLYQFDRSLRSHINSGLDVIEIYTRVAIALTIGQEGKLSYRDPSTYSPTLPNYRFEAILAAIDKNSLRHKSEMYKDYWRKYPGDEQHELPIWYSIESWDFGTISWCYDSLRDDLRDIISSQLSVESQTLSAWIKCLNYVRNCCAHHNRVWNHPLVYRQADPRIEDFNHCQPSLSRIYYMLCVVSYLLKNIDTGQQLQWVNRLKEVADSFPSFYKNSRITLRQAGFPEGWRNEALWKA
jgi:abortive infection bacteriophage resistance protein